MSEGHIITQQLPSIVTGHPLLDVRDVVKLDHTIRKVHRAILRVHFDLFAAGSPLFIFEQRCPTVAQLNNIIANPNFNYTNDLVNVYPEIAALAAYLVMDDQAPFPANFPIAFSWLMDFSVEEKQVLAKANWRTRNFHAMLPQFFAALQLIIVFAMADLYAIVKGKFRKVSATCFPDTKLQIPFDSHVEATWKAFMYRIAFNIDTVYPAQVRDNMIQHLFLTWDSYGFIIPEESAKLGELLLGKIKNFVLFDDASKVNYDYPIDILLEQTGFDDNVYGNDFTNHIYPLLIKVKNYMTSSYLMVDKIEYNDKFYKDVMSDFKKVLTPVSLDTKLLTDWKEMAVPWVQIYLGFHHDGAQGRYEALFRAFDGTNNFPNLAGAGTELQNMFTRRVAGLPAMLPGGQASWFYVHSIIPYGYNEEQWKLGFVFGWMYMTRFMGGMQLTTTVELDDLSVDLRLYCYYEYYDSNENLMRKIGDNALSTLAANVVQGWLATTDNIIFNDIYKPYLLASGAYATIDDVQLGQGINANDFVNVNVDVYRQRLMKLFTCLKMQSPIFQSLWTKEAIYKLVNPFIAPKASNQEKNVLKIEKDLHQSQPILAEASKPTSPVLVGDDKKPMTDKDVQKVDQSLGKLPAENGDKKETPKT